MIFVGLLSGAVYVNVFYMVQTDNKYKDERELCVNITAIFITVGKLILTHVANYTFLESL